MFRRVGRRWSPERPGSWARMSRGRSSHAATTCASPCAPARRARRSTGSTSTLAVAQLGDRAAWRRALRGVERVFHVAGTTHLRAPPAELARVNVEGTRMVLEEALRAGVERVVHTSSIGAVGPARPHGAVDERHAFPPGLGVPYAESKHAAETEALRVAAHGLAVVIVCPAHVFGPGDLGPTSTGVCAASSCGRSPPTSPARSTSSTWPTSPPGTCSRTSAACRAALHPRDAQLHLGPAVRRARAALGRRAPALELPRAWRSRWPRRSPRAARSAAGQRGRGPRGGLVDVPERQGAARAGLDDAAARGHGRGHVRWWEERLGERLPARRGRSRRSGSSCRGGARVARRVVPWPRIDRRLR